MSDAERPRLSNVDHVTNVCTDVDRTQGEPGTVISCFEYPDSRGTPGPGASHHFALGVPDGETLREWRSHLRERGVRVSPVRDRTYFQSIYLSDPDGLTIELCTEGPGFGVDEAVPETEFVEAPSQR